MKKANALQQALERVIELEEREALRALQAADLREAGEAAARALGHTDPSHPAIARWRDTTARYWKQEERHAHDDGGTRLPLGD